MKRLTNRLLRLLLVCALTSAAMPLYASPAAAYADAYPLPALTGNQAVDIVAVAKSQVGYMEDSEAGTIYGEWMTKRAALGYDFTYADWCSTFFCWCAEQAGINHGVVFGTLSASVNVFFASLVLSGATVRYNYANYTPKCGDFVFYSYDGNKMGHTAITDGNGNYIHANYASGVKENADNVVYRIADGLYYTPVCYVSPRYASNGATAAVSDTQPPTITGYNATNITADGFTVSVSATDNTSLARASFTVWTSRDGQDDVTIGAGTLAGDTFTFYVNTADHGGEYGDYNVEISVYDPLGNSAVLTDYVIYVPPVESEPPVISDVEISAVSADGFTVSCKVTDNTGVRKVFFPSWTSAGGADDLMWNQGVISGDTASCRILTANHGGAFGEYFAQIYAYDGAENYSFHDGISVQVPSPDATGPAITNVRIIDVTDTSFRLTGNASDESGVASAAAVVWTKTADGDEMASFQGEIDGESINCAITTANHTGENISYTVQLTVFDAVGNSSVYQTNYTPGVRRLSRGDPDGDGVVTSNDALLVLQATAGARTLSEAQKRVCDLDGDGLVTAMDARLLQRIAAGVATLRPQ